MMRPFERYSFLFWGLVVLVTAMHVAYVFHYWGIEFIWDVFHYGGHAAGWAGAAAMALSLLYIPRKKKWFTKGKVRTWYRAHVLLGLTGPLLIAFHAYGKYYGFGGLAFGCMWLTLLTGIIGFYLFRRLPDEVKARAEARREGLEKLTEIESRLRAWTEEAGRIKTDLDETGLLNRISNGPQAKLPRPTLAKSPKGIIPFVREYVIADRKSVRLKGRLRKNTRLERRAVSLKEKELLELLDLERDTRRLAALNEIFAVWRKVHVPLSWLTWILAALHLFGWIYY